ncbi:MAG: hypothetical protein IPL32_11570 [Chloracidobacterium sp.]|nr:hypothetical protein [Chloracidobacterium sp.]
MEIIRSAKPTKEMTDVKLWHCVGCGVVHMSVKNMVLNFPREEFAAFTESVVEINYSGWETPNPFSLIDLGEHDARTHTNCSVH